MKNYFFKNVNLSIYEKINENLSSISRQFIDLKYQKDYDKLRKLNIDILINFSTQNIQHEFTDVFSFGVIDFEFKNKLGKHYAQPIDLDALLSKNLTQISIVRHSTKIKNFSEYIFVSYSSFGSYSL